MSEQNQRNKARVLALWQELDAAPLSAIGTVAKRHLGTAFHWQGPAPLPELRRPEDFSERYAKPLKRALPDMRRDIHMFFGGHSEGKRDGSADGRMWVCGTGYLVGRQMADFEGILAKTNRPLRIRWAEFFRFDGDDIVQCQMLLDFADWFEQIGRPVLPVSRGIPFVYPAPTGTNGCLEAPQDAHQTAQTLSLIREFLFAGLNAFDKSNVKSMGVARYFHNNVKWYGPGGIGGCLSLKEFEDFHQKPWLVAFPDRKVQDLDSLFAEGRFTGSSGWSAVLATHTGPYLDAAPTNKPIRFNGIDFWLRDGDQFTENWVFVDMIDLFSQFGIDLFDRMKSSNGERPELIPVMPDDPL